MENSKGNAAAAASHMPVISLRRAGLAILIGALLAIPIGRLAAWLFGQGVAEFLVMVTLFSVIMWTIGTPREAPTSSRVLVTLCAGLVGAGIWIVVQLVLAGSSI